MLLIGRSGFIKLARRTACLLAIYSMSCHGAPVESWYQKVWCRGMGGQVEFRLKDGRRIDCLTETHAIEVEFAHNWPEAVGQSLGYSMLTDKKAGIVLILTRPTDDQHWLRLNKLIRHYQLPIKLWKLGP